MADRAPGEPGPLTYANLTGRPPGRLMRTAARLLPGPAQVESEILPYAAAWHTANLHALGGSNPRWVVFGDSMSTSIGADAPSRGWVGQAQASLAADGSPVDVINLAAYGARTEDVIAQQLPAWRGLPRSPAGEIVSVFIGANDLISRQWRAALPAAVDRLLQLLPVGSVVAAMPQRRPEARVANRALRDAAATGRVRLVEMAPASPGLWRGQLAGDHFHPNDRGYATIAAAFVPVLRQALADLPR